jgi:putative transposase
VQCLYIEPGSPWESGYNESFNGKLRDELSTERYSTPSKLTFSPKTGPADKLVFWHIISLEGEDYAMKKRFTEEQIAYALKQAETGTSVSEVIRKMGITEQTYYRWKKKYGGLGMSELRRLKQLEEENRKLKQMVADLSLDKHMLQEVLSKKL